ncbi:hypothetical protein [uncultured Agitococcus sp.]|uniref:hypothetical protein n=1 Tax=uncultured Agitococcus sp. TaxID=1506599 RepID=UPI00260CD915|nr:hypothetical protein [uncultured Agitococcus sp.]
MKALLQLFWQILRFKRGPEDVPYAPNLLWLLLIINLTISITAQSIGRPNQFNIAVTLPIIALGVESLCIFSLLHLKKLSNRFTQSLIAILGVDSFLSLATIPLLILGFQLIGQTPLLKFLGLLEVILLGWSIAIRAFIYHRALNIGLLLGNLMALMILLLTLSINVKVFPELLEQAKAAASQSSR